MFKKILFVTAACLTASSSFALSYYAGVGGGMSQNTENRNFAYIAQDGKQISATPYKINGNGFLGEAYVGLGQRLNKFYVGGELGGFYSNAYTEQSTIYNTIHYSSKLTNPFGASLSALTGFYIAPNNMIYAKAGGVFSEFKGSSSPFAWHTGYTGSFQKFDAGGQFGLGLTSQFTKQLSLRVEGDYNKYRKFTKANKATATQPIGSQTTYSPESMVLTVGLSYNF